MGIDFEWDEANIGHIARHRMTPEQVEEVFQNDPIMIDFEVVDGEERWTVIGHTSTPHFIIVVYTIRLGRIRTITARVASGRLRESYLQTKKLE